MLFIRPYTKENKQINVGGLHLQKKQNNKRIGSGKTSIKWKGKKIQSIKCKENFAKRDKMEHHKKNKTSNDFEVEKTLQKHKTTHQKFR